MYNLKGKNRCLIPVDKDAFSYEDLSRAMQYLVDTEHEAHRLYAQIARSTDNTKAIHFLKDVADEEKFYDESLKVL